MSESLANDLEPAEHQNERAHLRQLHRRLARDIGDGEYAPADHAAFDLWIQLTRVVMGYERCRNQSRRIHPLTAQERRALGLLWERGPMTLSQLAKSIPQSMPAASAMVNRLVTRGFVDRAVDPVDRRQVVLRATSLMLESMDASSFEGTARVVEALTVFTDAELATTNRVLQTIYAVEHEFASEFEALGDEELRALIASWERELADLDSATVTDS